MQDDQNSNTTDNNNLSDASFGTNSTTPNYSSTLSNPPINNSANLTTDDDVSDSNKEPLNNTQTTPSSPTSFDASQNNSQKDNNQEVVTAPHAPQKYGGKKIIATIFGILVLIGGVTAGVILVQHQQNIEEQAASGSDCDHSPDCFLVDNAPNRGSQTVDRQITYVEITDKDYHRYNPGNTEDECRRVNITGNTVTWERYGDGPNCKDVSNVQIWMEKGGEPSPTGELPEFVKICHYTADQSAHPWQAIEISKQGWENGHDEAHDFHKTEFDFFYTNNDPNCPWPEPGNQGITCADLWCENNSPNPTNPQTTASCSEVKAYDTSWTLLTTQELSSLTTGSVIRFTVSGESESGVFDKARFSVNSISLGETTLKKPGSDEFYIEYTIPEGVTSFNVDAQIHHLELGWF